MGIGKNIKLHRVKNNLTQKDLAEKLHISYQAVSKWEKDESEPSFDTVKEMAKIFGCSIDELFGVEKEEPKKEETIRVIEKIQEVVVKEQIVKDDKPLDRIEVVFLNVRQEIIERTYASFNWKLVSKTKNLNNNAIKYVFEREKSIENDNLDYEAKLLKTYMSITSERIVPRMFIYSLVAILFALTIYLIFINEQYMIVFFLVFLFSFIIPLILGFVYLIKNIVNRRRKLIGLQYLMDTYARNNNMVTLSAEDLMANMAKRKVYIMDLAYYRSMK